MNNIDMLDNCNLCIRNCNINRNKNIIGVCKTDNIIKIARADLHFWEEPCISGAKGSGTVFFSNCNLKCVFCQNHKISQNGFGKQVTIERLAEIFIELQNKGANNINLVTPTHYVPLIIESIKIAKSKGLILPIVYNTNSTDTLETIKVLNGYIDIYLPDFKYFDDKHSIKYSKIKGYSKNVIEIISEMIKQVGEPVFDENNIMKKGVIVRHLMLPGLLFDSKKVIDSIYNNFGDHVFISLMNQYTPLYNAKDYPEINKSVNPKLYANEKGIIVKNTPNASSDSVAELAIAHMFAVARFLGASNYTMRIGEWNKKKYEGIELSGKILGIIGMGRIGRALATKATALGMKVVYNDIFGKQNNIPYEFLEFDDLLSKSDFISLHVPYDKNKGPVIGKDEIEKMKDGAYLINCARGKVVDEIELLNALNTGKIAGAGIDVFEEEPTKNNELINHPNVSVTPHIGASTKEAQKRIGEEVITTIINYFSSDISSINAKTIESI